MSLRKGVIIQFTGLSGSGKTTLSNGVKSELESQGYKVALIDADVYRQTLCSDLGFSKADRLENIKRLGRLAKALAPDFDLILMAAINPYQEARNSIKEQYDAPLVFLDCPLDVLIARDPKGLYKKALLDEQDPDYIVNFTGISDPYERPEHTDMTLDTGRLSEQECVDRLVDYIHRKYLLQGADFQFITFLTHFFNDAFQSGNQKDRNVIFLKKSKIFKALFDLNNRDLYQFIFAECKDEAHLNDWLKERVGEESYRAAVKQFLEIENTSDISDAEYGYQLLTTEQLASWKENGYLVLSQFVDETLCNDVRQVICNELRIDPTDRSTWCPTDPRWQGVMLFSVQDEAVERIRRNNRVRFVFEDLYRSKALLSLNTPLGYMPPISTGYPFMASPLHWDIDVDLGARDHVQGMVYLEDVEEDGGAFSLIPGMHKKYESLMKDYSTMEDALSWLRSQNLEKKIAGKKGDLILWMETMPHAATPNQSEQSRFVQYVTFERADLM